MAREYDNTNRGALFRNEQRKTEKHPDYTGTIDIEGVEYRLAGWVRESKQGRKFLSLAATRVEDQRRDDDDDIPF